VNVAWYSLLPIFLLVFVALGYKIWSAGYVNWDIPVLLKNVNSLPSLLSSSTDYQVQGIGGAEAVLKLKVKLAPAIIGVVITFFCGSAVLLFGIIYQLRKILQSLKANVPFALDNVRRLRIISLFVFLSVVVNFLNSLYSIQLLNQYFPQASAVYMVKIAWGVTPLIISLVVFVLAEIFKQGYQLKTDNESFV
jgi:hypothetical protein